LGGSQRFKAFLRITVLLIVPDRRLPRLQLRGRNEQAPL
jgi:hypothetical protein